MSDWQYEKGLANCPDRSRCRVRRHNRLSHMAFSGRTKQLVSINHQPTDAKDAGRCSGFQGHVTYVTLLKSVVHGEMAACKSRKAAG